MKVIKEGTPPSEYEFRGECSHCKTVVQFKASEAKYYSHRNETYYSVNCPRCPKTITVEDIPANRVNV